MRAWPIISARTRTQSAAGALRSAWYYLGYDVTVVQGEIRNGWVIEEWGQEPEMVFFWERYFTSVYYCMHVSGWSI